MMNNKLFLSVAATSLALMAASPAKAETAAAAPVSLPMPQMAGPLGLDTTHFTFKAGPLNDVHVSGVASAMGWAQSNHTVSDKAYRADITNAQVFVQNTEGPVQFYLQAGLYELPALGVPYLRALKTTDNTYGYLPQGYLKYAPTSNFSIMAGKLPTLIGNEYTFTFQNMNIERGLLWNQENAVNRGVQANYFSGPFSLALSLNDGFYSGRYSWVTGLVTYSIDSNNAIAFDAGGNTSESSKSTFATPLAQNNSTIYNVMYTHTNGAWTLNPYLQYTHVDANAGIGINGSASTWGAAVLSKYTFDDNYSIAGRVEYIASHGTAASGAPNLLYGQGSKAWSVTVTPTYKFNMFFGRFDASYVQAHNTTAGSAFGDTGNEKSQARLAFEAGIMF